MEDDNNPLNKGYKSSDLTGKRKHDVARNENHDTPLHSPAEHFQKRDTESPEMYRAFLLFAMQKSKKRSNRKVADAMEKSDFLIRKWRKQHDWEARINKESAQADRRAIKAYVGRCVGVYTPRELAAVSRNCRFDPLAVLAKEAPRKAEIVKPRLMPVETVSDTVKAVAQQVVDAEEAVHTATSDQERNKAIADQKKIVRAVIGRGIEGIKDGSMKVSSRDLMAYLELQQRVLGFGQDNGVAVQGVESVRVKMARDQGKDVFSALGKDLVELRSMWDLINEKRAQDEVHQEQVEAERAELLAQAAEEG